MDKFPSQEREPKVDFLNENLRVSFEVSPDALEHLPVVSPEDERSGLERFAVLLGTKRINQDGSVHLEIKGVYQETEDDTYGSYVEGVENVSYDLALIKRRVQKIQTVNPGYKDFGFLGDLHTHPVSNVPEPSIEDLLSMMRAYESGDLKANEPYVFGIGARHPSGEMEYWFYRIVRTNSESGYGYKALNH